MIPYRNGEAVLMPATVFPEQIRPAWLELPRNKGAMTPVVSVLLMFVIVLLFTVVAGPE